MDLKQLKNSLFSSTSAFQQEVGEVVQPPSPVRVTNDKNESVINLLESALLEMTERQYDDSIEIAISYVDEALEILR